MLTGEGKTIWMDSGSPDCRSTGTEQQGRQVKAYMGEHEVLPHPADRNRGSKDERGCV